MGGVYKGFKLPYYDRTTGKLKGQITGAEAQPQKNGLELLVQKARIEDYLEDGSTNLTATTRECFVDPKNRVAFSAGRLEVETSHGQLTIQGLGFFYQQTNFDLTISNQVETVIKRELLRTTNTSRTLIPALAKTNAPLGTNQFIKIFSDHFLLQSSSNLAYYSSQVRVDDPQMELGCDSLVIHRSTNGSVETIVADENVAMTNKLDPSVAVGQRAVYSLEPDKELVVLTGQPARWRDKEQEAEAGTFTFDRRANTVRAEQKPSMKLPRSAFHQPDWLVGSPATPTNAPALTNQFVEFTAEEMVIHLATTNQLSRRISARTNVLIVSLADQSRATSDQALYDESNGTLELTGKAVWQSDQRLVKGEMLIFDRTNKFIRAQRNTYLKMPLSSLGGRTTPLLPKAPAPPEVIEVFSDDFLYQPTKLTFHEKIRANYLQGELRRGSLTCGFLALGFTSNRIETLVARQNVAAEQPAVGTNDARRTDKRLNCESMTIHFYTNGLVQNLLAETNVFAQQTETRSGRPLPIHTELTADSTSISFFAHTNQVREIVALKNVSIVQDTKKARGNKAVYTASNNVVELNGNPTAETPMGRITEAEVLIWDRTRNTLRGRGERVIGEGEMPGKGTNRTGLLFPKSN